MKNQNNAVITVRPEKATNTISFYISGNGESHYIFSKKFNGCVYDYFRKGVPMYRLFDYSKTGGDQIVIHTIQRIVTMLKYIESEYEMKLIAEKKRDRRSTLRYKKNRSDRYCYNEDIA